MPVQRFGLALGVEEVGRASVDERKRDRRDDKRRHRLSLESYGTRLVNAAAHLYAASLKPDGNCRLQRSTNVAFATPVVRFRLCFFFSIFLNCLFLFLFSLVCHSYTFSLLLDVVAVAEHVRGY